MKKQTVVVLWSLAILLLVGGCFGGYIYGGIKKSGEERGIEVFSCMPADIVEYSVSGGGAEDSYTLERRGEEWAFEGGGAAVADAEKVESLINAASRITALKRISEAERKHFKTAAGTAEKMISLKLRGGKEFRVEFLGTGRGSSAFKVNTDDGIYTMNTSMRDILTPAKEKLSVTAIFDGGTILKIEYRDPNGRNLEIERETDDSGNARYAVTKPLKIRGDYEKAEQIAESDIPSMKIVKFVENPSDNMENYGLDEASSAFLTVTTDMSAADDAAKEAEEEKDAKDAKDTKDTKDTKATKATEKTVVLRLGKTDGGAVYAVKEGEEGVFMINSRCIELLRSELSYAEELEAESVEAEGNLSKDAEA